MDAMHALEPRRAQIAFSTALTYHGSTASSRSLTESHSERIVYDTHEKPAVGDKTSFF